MVGRRHACWLPLMLAVAGIGLSPIIASLLRGDETPAPPPPSRAAAETASGSLVICGGGRLPESILHEFVELAGGRSARIVVVTTASGLADGPGIAGQLGFWLRQPVASLHILHTRSRARADDPAFSAVLEQATGIWFLGGEQSRITAAYLGTLTERRMHDVLRRGGVVGGTSAGAAVMSRVMIRGGKTVPQLGLGLGFLPGTIIDQHFLKRRREGRLREALAMRPELVGIGIDEGTAIIVRGTELTVRGTSRVCLFPPPGETGTASPMQRLASGAHVDLQALRSSAGRMAVAESGAE